jgi:cytochrome b561
MNFTKSTTTHYSSLSIGLHWLMLLLLAAIYACIELREIYPKGSDPREALKTWHFMLGLSLPALVALRLGARIAAPIPAITPDLPAWQKIPATLVHMALYAFMIAMPLAGWLILSGEGKPVPFFGLQLPALIAENKDLAKSIKELHQLAGTVGYYLIGLHAAAALLHHYLVRDNTLKRMLPHRE